MPLAPGTRLGVYEIVSQIGAGGMGEVYKARDPKLDRNVAIKVLPPSMADNADMLARFEREAKAVAALSHPNVLGIFDFGREGNTLYAVMELLEGESLRERLQSGAMAPKKAVELALQFAQGLSAAHEKGIVHRDLKPDNLFITKEGRLKVLDFGLAKQLPPALGTDDATLAMSRVQSPANGTESGMILGTVGYMSPEQVKGLPADHRSDIFAFGVVLYEMLSGARAFHRGTSVQTLNAILEDDPPEIEATKGQVTPFLQRLVFHCLEKSPENRFQSMKDVAFDLMGAVSESSRMDRVEAPAKTLSTQWLWAGLGIAGVLAGGLLLILGGLLHVGRPIQLPTFTRLTFAPGAVESALFGPDGRTIYFSQRLNGGKPEIFVIHPSSPEPKPLGVEDALLLGVSATNELAVLRSPQQDYTFSIRGRLAQVSGGGGSIREMQDAVLGAAWDGQGMAILSRDDRGMMRLEFPTGKVIFNPANSAAGALFAKYLRVSGDRLALVESNASGRLDIITYDRSGKRSVHFTKLGDTFIDTVTGLAWGPGGDLWFSELQGDQTAVWALALGGKRRLVSRSLGSLQLMDVASDGRMLLAAQQVRRGVLVVRAGEAKPKDLSILGGTQAWGLSRDGQTLLLLESPALDGRTSQDQAYVRKTDGSPAVKLTKGTPMALSSDGMWANLLLIGVDPKDLDAGITEAIRQAGMDPSATLDPKALPGYLLFVPTGMGRAFALALPKGLWSRGYAYLHPDGQQVVFAGTQNSVTHWYLMDRKGGPPRSISKEGEGELRIDGLSPLSPDGTRLIVTGNLRDWHIQPLAGGPSQLIKGMQPGERVAQWAEDGRNLFVRSGLSVLPVTLHRLDPVTGSRQLVSTFLPPDPVGHIQMVSVWTTPDARTSAYTYDRKLSELYLVDGVK